MLRTRHRALVQQILNLNQSLLETDRQASLRWKVLIYDQKGLNILSTLLKVSKLLEVGVTFYGSIKQKREPIPDVSAVYLLEPTPENLRLIAQDCATPLYDQMYINFLSPISSQDLEYFASEVNHFSDGQCIHAIFDQYIEFSSIDPNLFTLYEQDNTMESVFGFKTTDELLETTCRAIGSSLASVFLTAGEIPRILYKKDNHPASLVSQAFAEVIKPLSQNFELWGSRRSETPNAKPPLLIILDRSIDFASQLHHPCTYQALIHDQFGINKNQVKINGNFHDLDTDIDKLWCENKSKTFDSVLEAIGKEAKQFKAEYGAIDNDLDSALKNLPELSHKRLSLDTHTKVGDALVETIKAKKADALFKFEEDIVLQSTVDVHKLIDFLRSLPDTKDKLRLATFAFLCKVFSKDQISIVQDAVGASLDFLIRFDSFRIDLKKDYKIASMLRSVSPFGSQSDSNALAEKLPVVETTRRLLEESIEGFQLINPLTSSSNPNENIGNVYVFVIGPGNYTEFNGLCELGRQRNIEITYGCTSMMRPNEFLDALMK
ncbi:Sec1 family protein [Tritrichomonas foetus]|uniref:Sec1 family protein n=1 Tax=Tritrichomonas foetus TaxID=1144522 RepID=A0A1J4KLH6_9EUKA|nr:Sec1 family protein [Tritrichomonas foetus]|eukprot:OHT12159.1 Sec1 family protein [Tritrichomonas foetus]